MSLAAAFCGPDLAFVRWGNVPVWFAAVGTVGALGYAVFATTRERQCVRLAEERARAVGVSAWADMSAIQDAFRRDLVAVVANLTEGEAAPVDVLLVRSPWNRKRGILAHRQRKGFSEMPEPPQPIDPWRPPPPAEAGEGVGGTPAGSMRPVDKVSIAAFAVSLIGAGIVAIPLAIWGLTRTKPSSRRGRGLAVAALAISAAWTAVASVLLLTSGLLGGTQQAAVPDVSASIPAATPSTTASATGSPSTHVAVQPTGPMRKSKRIYWENLKPTMCVRLPTHPTSIYITVVDCRAGHNHEVTAHTVLSGPKKWPGDSANNTAAEAKCRPAFERYVGIGFDESRLDFDFLTPDRAAWQAGNRRLICFVLDPSEAKLTQALRGAAE